MKNERRQIKSRNREDRSNVHQRIANADIEWLRETEYYWQQKNPEYNFLRYSTVIILISAALYLLFLFLPLYYLYSYFCRSVVVILISAALLLLFLFLPLYSHYSYFCRYYSYFCRSIFIILISAALYLLFLFLPLYIHHSYFCRSVVIILISAAL